MTELTPATLGDLGQRVTVPVYRRDALQVGVVHFGVGAFHRAHQEVYLDAVAATGDTQWGVCGVGLLPQDAVARDAALAQGGLYTLTTTAPDGAEQVRVVGTLVRYLYGPDDPEAVLAVVAEPTTRIVTMTITEGAYGIDDATGEFDPHDEPTLLDLAGSPTPQSVFGYLTAALRRRRNAGVPPFTVLSCDNMPLNGRVAAKALTSFARQLDPELAAWIDAEVHFPCCMVDRITPVPDEETRHALLHGYGVRDRWALRSESFIQWVVEDDFPAGRPDLGVAGVQLVPDVGPYELMKIRLLNAGHQAVSHLGVLDGLTWVHDACRDPLFTAFLRCYWEREAIPTLHPVPGVDLAVYCDTLVERFASESVRDTLERIVVDSSDRLAKHLVPVLRDQLAVDGPIDCVTLVIASWGLCLAAALRGNGRTIADRRAPELLALAAEENVRPGALLDLGPVFGDLAGNARFRDTYLRIRERLRQAGPRAVMAELVG